MKAKLTNEFVRDAGPGEYWDTDLPGFVLRVTKEGTKSFVVRYRVKGTGRAGKKQFWPIGRFGVLTPAQARAEGKRILGLVATGSDPAADAAKAKETPTVAGLGEFYLTQHARPKKKASTAALYKIFLDKHLTPALGTIKADMVTRAAVQRLHLKIGTAHPATANRVIDFLAWIYSYGAKHGQLPEGLKNPAIGIEKFKEQPKDRYLTTEELERLGAALREAETIGIPYEVDETKAKAKHAPKVENRRTILSPFATAAVRLLLFTGARLREVLDLRWEMVDLERGLLFLPDSKTGRKPIILGAPAAAVIAALPRASVYVIAGDDPSKPRADLKRPWGLVSRRAGLEGVRIHDLRHSFASVGAGASLGLPIIGSLLGHKSVTTTQRYAHLHVDPLKRAADTIGATIAAAMDGGREEAPVVQLKAK